MSWSRWVQALGLPPQFLRTQSLPGWYGTEWICRQKTRFEVRKQPFGHLCTPVFMVSHAGLKSAEIIDLGSKHQIGKLSIRQEDDEEHDGKTHKVLGTARHSGGELTHGLVEVDELKKLRGKERPVININSAQLDCEAHASLYLDPRKKDDDRRYVVELDLQVG